jgi:hypothetical protein
MLKRMPSRILRAQKNILASLRGVSHNGTLKPWDMNGASRAGGDSQAASYAHF